MGGPAPTQCGAKVRGLCWGKHLQSSGAAGPPSPLLGGVRGVHQRLTQPGDCGALLLGPNRPRPPSPYTLELPRGPAGGFPPSHPTSWPASSAREVAGKGTSHHPAAAKTGCVPFPEHPHTLGAVSMLGGCPTQPPATPALVALGSELSRSLWATRFCGGGTQGLRSAAPQGTRPQVYPFGSS